MPEPWETPSPDLLVRARQLLESESLEQRAERWQQVARIMESAVANSSRAPTLQLPASSSRAPTPLLAETPEERPTRWEPVAEMLGVSMPASALSILNHERARAERLRMVAAELDASFMVPAERQLLAGLKVLGRESGQLGLGGLCGCCATLHPPIAKHGLEPTHSLQPPAFLQEPCLICETRSLRPRLFRWHASECWQVATEQLLPGESTAPLLPLFDAEEENFDNCRLENFELAEEDGDAVPAPRDIKGAQEALAEVQAKSPVWKRVADWAESIIEGKPPSKPEHRLHVQGDQEHIEESLKSLKAEVGFEFNTQPCPDGLLISSSHWRHRAALEKHLQPSFTVQRRQAERSSSSSRTMPEWMQDGEGSVETSCSREAFNRLVKETLGDVVSELTEKQPDKAWPERVGFVETRLLQLAAETFIQELYSDAGTFAHHAKHKSVMPSDFRLAICHHNARKRSAEDAFAAGHARAATCKAQQNRARAARFLAQI